MRSIREDALCFHQRGLEKFDGKLITRAVDKNE